MADYTPSRLVHSFERHLRAENRSERTVENYLESLHQAEVFLRSRGRRLEEATKADLEDFLADLLARRSASTAATRYKVLRILYRWLEEEEDVPSPMARMKPPIVPEQPIPVIPEDGLRRLLKVYEGRGFEARRDTALIMLLLDTGARRGELVGLKLADVDLDLDVRLVLGKGRRERGRPKVHRAASGATDTSFLDTRSPCGAARPSGWPTPAARATGSWSPGGCARRWEDTEGDKRSVTEIEPTARGLPQVGHPPRSNAPAIEATAPQPGPGGPAESGGDLNDPPPF